MTDEAGPAKPVGEGIPQALTLADLLAAIWRRRIAAGCVGLVVAVSVAISMTRITPLFEAKASLAIDHAPTAVQFQADPDNGRVEYTMLNTQRDLLLSNQVLSESLQRSALMSNPVYDRSHQPVTVLRKRLKVVTSRDSLVIVVSLRDEDPERARQGLEIVLRTYLSQQLERHSDHSKGALAFLAKQVADERERVERSRAREQEFRDKHSIVGSDPDRNQLSETLRGLEAQKLSLDHDRAATKAVQDQIAAADDIAEPESRLQAMLHIEALGRSETVVQQRRELSVLRDRELELSQKYLDLHPRMIEVRHSITNKRLDIAQEVAMARSTVEANAEQLRARLQALQARITVVEDQLSDYRSGLLSLRALEEETRSHESLFHQLLTNLGQEQISSQMESQRVMVIDPPRSEVEPVNVRKPLFLAAALFIGLAAMAASALLLETYDGRVFGGASLQALTGRPVLAHIPFIADLKALGRGGDPEQPPEFAESYRLLRAALRLVRRPGETTWTIVVTSACPGDGKSTVSTRLAITLAATGSKVLLIDADMRRSSLDEHIGEHCEHGLSSVLTKTCAVAPVSTSYANLDYLGAGEPPSMPAELLLGPGLDELLTWARSSYQYVIIDTPPLGLIADALTIAERSDMVLLVARDATTPKRILRQVVAKLAPISDLVRGTVLNGERLQDNAYYAYSYYYKSKKSGSASIPTPAVQTTPT